MLTSEDISSAIAVYQARHRVTRTDLAASIDLSLKQLETRLHRCGEDNGTLWMLLRAAETFGVQPSRLLAEAENIHLANSIDVPTSKFNTK